LLANGGDDAAVMRGDVIRLLGLVAFLDDEIAFNVTRAQIFRRALPRLRAAFQAIKQLPEIETAELNDVVLSHTRLIYLARYCAMRKPEIELDQNLKVAYLKPCQTIPQQTL
jgi:hypothetical protein